MKRLLEWIFGLDRSFLNQQGDLSIQFDPRWPSHPLIELGWGNWLIGAIALALLFYLIQLFRSGRASQVRTVGLTFLGIFLAARLVTIGLAIKQSSAVGDAYVGALVASIAALACAIAIAITLFRSPDVLARFGLILGMIDAVVLYCTQLAGSYAWNLSIGVAALVLVIFVYRREGRSRGARISLAVIRCMILGFVLFLLNLPVFTIGQSRTEPSVLAIMVDDTISMRVKDVQAGGNNGEPISRLDAVVRLMKHDDQALIKDLAKKHILHFYRFDRQAIPTVSLVSDTTAEKKDASAADAADKGLNYTAAIQSLEALKPTGENTQVLNSLRGVMEDLQGQRLAGIVLITDGRDTPKEMVPEGMATLKNYGVKVYPVVVGTDKAPKNLSLEEINVQDAAFEGDIVNIRATVRGVGFEAGHRAKVQAINKKTGLPLLRADGRPVEKEVVVEDDKPVEVELQWKPDRVEVVDIDVIIAKEPGELDEDDNLRSTQVAVLDAKINVLYVEGYPRWEYRYVKNEMIRDQTVNISCLLTSADPTFAQEGDPADPKTNFPGPIKRFPESIEEILKYDVIVFGDVDPRQFTDAQLQLVKDFVSKRGGGFGMIAGPRYAPVAYRNSALEEILPVFISRVQEGRPASIKEGFRPELTKDGADSSIFRFFEDKEKNARFIKNDIQPIFWFCQGVQAKPGVGEVYAQHPSVTAPDGRKAPLLVLGRYGAGRTLFSAIDDSWRWRFYTGEAVFDTYWIQQFRYLARSKKLGQRKLTFQSFRPSYDLGDQIRLSLKVLDPQLLTQLPDQIPVEINGADGKSAYRENLVKQEGQVDLYMASYTADKIGKFEAVLPPIAGGVDAMNVPFEVNVPRLELSQPQVDRTLLTRLAAETNGKTYELDQAQAHLAADIPSAAKQIPVEISEPIWNKNRALVLFVLLITVEWVLRKVYGML